jgi:hypothetical protein
VTLEKTFTPSTGLDVTRIKDAGRLILSSWHKKLDLPSNDPTVAFDTAGMIRIPNSYNSKRGCWGLPVDTDMLNNLSHNELEAISQEPSSGYIKHGNKGLVLKLKERKQLFKSKRTEIVNLPDLSIDGLTILPCLAQAAMGEGNPTHRARFQFASYLASRLRWFFPPDQVKLEEKEKHINFIVDVISNQGWADWDENVTRFQVENIVMGGSGNNGYNAGMCRTIISDGLCTGMCKFYDGTAEGMI